MSNPEVIDGLAYIIFIIAVAVTIYFRERARKVGAATGKRIRSLYRKAWVEAIIKKGDQPDLINTIRNNITVSVALLSAIIISFGFVINAGVIKVDGNFFHLVRIVSIISLLGYSLFMILLEIRTLTYIPIVSQVPESLIKKYDNTDKASYMAKLLHESYDYFSNSIRSLFYIAPLMIWFYNVYLFIVLTLIISYAMHSEDFGTKSGITTF